MAPSRSRGHDNQESAKKASFPMGDQLQKWKSPFGLYADSDMLVWLKGLALDPCDQKASPDSARQLWNQTLKVRKFLLLGNAESPRRKRTLDQFLKVSKFAEVSRLHPEKSDVHSVKRLSTGHSVSCLTHTNANNGISKPQLLSSSHGSGSLLTSEDEYHGKPGSTYLTSMDMENYGASCKDNSASPLFDTDESNNGLNTLNPKNLRFSDATFANVNDTANSSDSPSLEENSTELERALRCMIFSDDYLPRCIPVRDFDGSVHYSDSSRSMEQNLKLREAVRLLFTDGSLPISVVPTGPCFQADVPEWTGPVNRKTLYGGGDSAALKWLGMRTWPIKGKSAGTTVKALGKGRSNSCSCISPGSVGCVKLHIHEQRLLLQFELGSAFRSWKFDEMGEFVSKSWTSTEQQNFESLMKVNPLSNEASFWKIAYKRFPSKSRKSILNYYYNVYIPRRMSLQTRSSCDKIDSDDDEAEE
ncbi:hypothetical protein ACFX13_033607 [Malus domestica]|uniref:ELM2 domain-containing protein n=1 Tax=Malus domestica TaxID=3750 RepID=A0A498K3U9_MALDO|nr:uncharacterized protein LOC103433574 [Malus domestica]XP_008370062.2 uncharacterized protein LOC103433574 [Malus domestica]RXI02076.1 hypothetical protein DVH24_026606 [Malus domestica]